MQSEVKTLKVYYDKRHDPDLTDLYGGNPHTVADMFKGYFRELPEALLTFELYDCFIAANGLAVFAFAFFFFLSTSFCPCAAICVADSRLDCIQKIVGFLPARNYVLLVYLCKFLRLVTTFSASNKMSAKNIAMVFAPNLLRPRSESALNMIEESSQTALLMQTLIDEFEFIFGEEVVKEQFDFEYFVRGQKPPPPVTTAAQVSVAPAVALQQARSKSPTPSPVPVQVAVAPVVTNPLTATVAPTLPPPPSQAPAKKLPPPKPPKDAPEKVEKVEKAEKAEKVEKVEKIESPPSDDEGSDDDEALRPRRTLQKPASRPHTIVDSPPVRAPETGEISMLTMKFTRLSRLIPDNFDVSSLPPVPSVPPKDKFSNVGFPPGAPRTATSPPPQQDRPAAAKGAVSPPPPSGGRPGEQQKPIHPGDYVVEPLKTKKRAETRTLFELQNKD